MSVPARDSKSETAKASHRTGEKSQKANNTFDSGYFFIKTADAKTTKRIQVNKEIPQIVIEVNVPLNKIKELEQIIDKIKEVNKGNKIVISIIIGLNAPVDKFDQHSPSDINEYKTKDLRKKVESKLQGLEGPATKLISYLEREDTKNGLNGVLGTVIPYVWTSTNTQPQTEGQAVSYNYPFFDGRSLLTLDDGAQYVYKSLDGASIAVRGMDIDVINDPLLDVANIDKVKILIKSLASGEFNIFTGGYDWDMNDERLDDKQKDIVANINKYETLLRIALFKSNPAYVYFPEPNFYSDLSTREIGAEKLKNFSGEARTEKVQQGESYFYTNEDLIKKYGSAFKTTKPLKTYFENIFAVIKKLCKNQGDNRYKLDKSSFIKEISKVIEDVRQSHMSWANVNRNIKNMNTNNMPSSSEQDEIKKTIDEHRIKCAEEIYNTLFNQE
ncbi:hypothetical protein [Hymenobacter sp. GOD-10R]|uniref:hypothetical protein n=1 Tax=Hymenobacter sp. GOD-10R TaxID=3093922 RepID=UPI002D77E530|nr:hypothetical protein [Hymenobacter sp. GOD-10R]WRQ31284.1 hypothetical protein SD425_13535 [Hymenobacter sp. GOD-10R]